MTYLPRQQSSTNYPITFLMVLSIDHLTGATGKTVTVTLSKNGGAFGAANGAVNEIGNGWYALAGNATDRNTLGGLAIHATATGCDPVDFVVPIITQDMFASNFGLSNVSANVAQWLGVVPNALVSGRVDGYLGAVASGVIAAASFAANALDAVWSTATRTLTAFAFGVTVATNNDKTGYALTAGEHTNITTDTQNGLTAQGYTTVRAPYLDTLNGLVPAIWAALTSGMNTAGSIGKLIKDYLDAAISSRMATFVYTTPLNSMQTAQAVLNAVASSYNTPGTIGEAINSSGALIDPLTNESSDYAVGTIGADLDIAISTRQTLGAGATPEIITIEVGSTPLAGVDVWATTDLGNTNVIARGYTDSFGNVTFYLDAGTYYIWQQLAGYSFTNPQTLVVS